MDKVKNVIMKHPNLSAWFVLALGMVLILIYEAQDVGLQISQWFWLILVTILVAGTCIWIINWGMMRPSWKRMPHHRIPLVRISIQKSAFSFQGYVLANPFAEYRILNSEN